MIRAVEVESDFLPRVGDIINAYDHFDDVDADLKELGWFFIVYEIDWSVEGTRLEPTLKLCSAKLYERRDILRRRGWLQGTGEPK